MRMPLYEGLQLENWLITGVLQSEDAKERPMAFMEAQSRIQDREFIEAFPGVVRIFALAGGGKEAQPLPRSGR